MGRREVVSADLDVAPEQAFALITDVRRLPAWNQAITEVVEAPERLEVGAVWKVRLRALGQTWVSRAQVLALDPETGRFAHRSQSDDGNPSFADWEWLVEPRTGGCRVTVSVSLNPVTFWRRHLLIRLRQPSLAGEMRASLEALAASLMP